MTEETFISYEEFKEMAYSKAKEMNNADGNELIIESSEKTAEELIEEANKIMGYKS